MNILNYKMPCPASQMNKEQLIKYYEYKICKELYQKYPNMYKYRTYVKKINQLKKEN